MFYNIFLHYHFRIQNILTQKKEAKMPPLYKLKLGFINTIQTR